MRVDDTRREVRELSHNLRTAILCLAGHECPADFIVTRPMFAALVERGLAEFWFAGPSGYSASRRLTLAGQTASVLLVNGDVPPPYKRNTSD